MDDLDGSKRQYTGDYTVLLVAGGETLDSMHVFNAYEADQYNNQRDKAIWSTLEDLSNRDVLPVGAENTWACSTGSPCKRVFPREFQGSGSSGPPEYFVRFLITTRRSTDTSLDEESSVRDFGNDLGYCDLTTVVTMRIHSIPLDDAVAFIILWVTFGTVILFVVVLFLIKYKGYSQFAERLRVEHEKMLEEESDEEYSDCTFFCFCALFCLRFFLRSSVFTSNDSAVLFVFFLSYQLHMMITALILDQANLNKEACILMTTMMAIPLMMKKATTCQLHMNIRSPSRRHSLHIYIYF